MYADQNNPQNNIEDSIIAKGRKTPLTVKWFPRASTLAGAQNQIRINLRLSLFAIFAFFALFRRYSISDLTFAPLRLCVRLFLRGCRPFTLVSTVSGVLARFRSLSLARRRDKERDLTSRGMGSEVFSDF
jgi:hypothetical protein